MNDNTITTGILQTRASFSPSTFKEEDKSVEVVWTTGERVLRQPFFGESYYEELDVSEKSVNLDRLNSGAPVLDTHRNGGLDNVIGVVDKAWITNGQGRATIRFSDREEVQPIVKDVKNGVIRNISVGYSVAKYQDVSKDNAKIKTYRAIDWQPMEISLVPIGADSRAHIRSSSEEQMNITTIIKETIMDNIENKEVETRTIEPQVDASALIAQERTRIADITKTVRAANLPVEFAEDLIGKGATIEQARGLILDEVIKNQPKVFNTTTVTVDSSDKFRSGVTNAIEIRAGYAKDDRTNEFRGESMMEIAKRALMNESRSTLGDKNAIVSRAFVSTSDFPYILANLANKYLKKGYEESESTWEKWTSIVSVPDFKPQTFVALSEYGLLKQIPEGAEYGRGNFSEGKETVTISTWGDIYSISRQAIVNDDVNAFTRIPAAMGMAAKRTINKSVYDKLFANPTLVTDSTAVFHANHGNLGTGAISGGITVSTLDAARAAMRKQQDLGKTAYLNISPSVILVPAALEGTAKVIVGSQYDPDATSKLQRVNSVYNMVQEVVVDPLLDANSAVAWYLISKQYDAFIVGFLDGNQTPEISTEQGFNVDGLSTKIRLDWGVGVIDFRPVYKHTGA